MSGARQPKPPVLGQKYRLIQLLDAGGMGAVWVAEALHLSSIVAIKIMDRNLTATPEAAQRFMREARTAASLRSPHVVQILDYGVHDGTPFIAMELLEGESLAARLKREGKLASWEQTELVLRHVARALGRAHDAGVIHRDLKPANIFLVRDEEEEIVKLLDFGVAKTTASSASAPLDSNTRTGEFLGSPAYASPEQLQASKALDHRADIWSLGVIAYECLLGRLPFVSDSFVGLLLAICAGPIPVPSEQGLVPAGFDAWFARVCARDVELRFQSVREASAELKRMFGAAYGSRPAPSGPETRSRPALDRRLPEAAPSGRATPSSARLAPETAASGTPSSARLPSRTDTVMLAASPAPAALPASPERAALPASPPPALPASPPPMEWPASPPPMEWPAGNPALIPTQTVLLGAPGKRVAARRKALALSAALALPAVVALVFFTLEASTSRAALDWKLLELSVRPPSEPSRSDIPTGGQGPPGHPSAPGDEPVRFDPGDRGDRPPPRVTVVPDPAPAIDTSPDAGADPEGSSVPAVSAAARGRISTASERSASLPAPARPEPRPRTRSAASSPARLTITANAPSDVLLDGEPIGATPLEGISVHPGVHEVTFLHDGERSVETLTIRSGEHKRVEAQIALPPGDGLDEAAVKRTIKSYRNAVVDTCWDDAFGSRAPGDPTSVRVPVTITVQPSGVVQSVVASSEPSGYPELCRCIEERVSTWKFPSARADTVVSVAFVFALK